MRSIEHITISAEAPLRAVLERFDAAATHALPTGIALVVDDQRRLVGTVTEGDVRRALLAGSDMDERASSFMQRDPITFSDDSSIVDILELLPEELARRGRRSKKFLSKVVLVDDRRRPTRVLDYHELWEQRIATHRHVVVVGLGYVGLTLGLALADEGFMVTGVDVDELKLSLLQSGESYVHETGLPELLDRHLHRNFRVSGVVPQDGDVYVVTVGTPLLDRDGTRSVVIDHLLSALDHVARALHPGNLVILRSTVPVGTCSRVAIPRLEEKTGLRCGIDFHLAFAPERTAEGRALQELRELPQIIGGFNADSVEATAALFREMTTTLVRVESLEAAEMAKLVNNSYRDLIFAFANEVTLLATQFDLDIVEVIKAANQGYGRDQVPLPSPGVGGPCLTKDPYILASIRDPRDSPQTLSEHGRAVNESMRDFVARRVLEQLAGLGKAPSACRLLVCGLAFKGDPETDDLRDSSGVAIAQRLKHSVLEVRAHDPVVAGDMLQACGLEAVDLPGGFVGVDGVLFLNNHRSYEHVDLANMIAVMAPRALVFDGWHLFRAGDVIAGGAAVYMGLSFSRRAEEVRELDEPLPGATADARNRVV